MAGGTSRKDHSEIGSSYIHFNFTPHQDKATASLIGDVPNGVFLKQPPIFLGGQGGLVGPAKLAFGTVIPAGQIWRGNVEQPNQLVARAGFKRDLAMNYNPNTFSSISQIVRNNLTYIGNILALDAWHRVVRSRFLNEYAYQEACRVGARKRLADILSERLNRLDELLKKVEKSFANDPSPQKENQELVQQWAKAKDALTKLIEKRDTVVVPSEVTAIVNALPAKDYLTEVQALSDVDSTILTLWLTYHVATVEKLMPTGRSSCCG
jgi:UDP-N-acetylglucosamine/UDP-N-acetylgalactosamine diphosphorylase